MTPVVEIMLAAGQAPWWWGWTLLAAALFASGWLAMGGRMGKRRHRKRRERREAERAELLNMPVTEYLALSRAERKRRIRAELARVPIRAVGSGLLPLPGERQRQIRAQLEARRTRRLLETVVNAPKPGGDQ